MRPFLATLVGSIVVTTARPAVADAPIPDFFPDDGWYLKGGLELGGVCCREQGAGFVVGGATTLVRLEYPYWGGLQTDVVFDTNGDADAGVRGTIGPEGGIGFLGGDLSYVLQRAEGDTASGLAGRFKVTLGFAAVYVRYGQFFGGDGEQFLDFGLQLKLGEQLSADPD